MNANQKVNNTFEALDLEFEILSKAQQQVVMGGSGGSSGGYDQGDTLVNKMFGIGTTASGGTFDTGSTDPIKLANLKSALNELADTEEGYELLTKVFNSGKKIKLTATELSNGRAEYDPNNINNTDGSTKFSGTLDIGGLSSGTQGAGLAGHEMFHALEDIRGLAMGNTSSEAQATLFQAKVDRETGFGTAQTRYGEHSVNPTTGAVTYTTEGQKFQDAMQSALTGGFNKEKLAVIIDNFGEGYVNSGAYVNLDDVAIIDPDSPNIMELIGEFLQ